MDETDRARPVRPRARRHLRSGAADVDRRADRGRARARRRRRLRRAGPLRRHRGRARRAARDRRRDRRGDRLRRRRRRARRRHRPLPGVQRAGRSPAAATGASSPSPGCTSARRSAPIASAGLFVPSGKASYPSVAYQLGVPAVVAGVPRDRPRRAADPRRATARSIRRCSSCAASSASPTCSGSTARPAWPRSGFGTESIPRVRKIVGPGSPAVTCAQVEMQRHGVATMMLLGPTESLVIADATADPVRLAADLLIEAEHGTDSSVVLVTTSADARRRRPTPSSPGSSPTSRRRGPTAARASLGANGGCVLVDDLDEAVAVANRYAPEHLQVAVADADDRRASSTGCVNAGEILVGQHTPFSAANFVIGCPASLPTSGFAEVSSGITVEAFLKRTAIARADAARAGPHGAVDHRPRRPRGLPGPRRGASAAGDRRLSDGQSRPARPARAPRRRSPSGVWPPRSRKRSIAARVPRVAERAVEGVALGEQLLDDAGLGAHDARLGRGHGVRRERRRCGRRGGRRTSPARRSAAPG